MDKLEQIKDIICKYHETDPFTGKPSKDYDPNFAPQDAIDRIVEVLRGESKPEVYHSPDPKVTCEVRDWYGKDIVARVRVNVNKRGVAWITEAQLNRLRHLCPNYPVIIDNGLNTDNVYVTAPDGTTSNYITVVHP